MFEILIKVNVSLISSLYLNSPPRGKMGTSAFYGGEGECGMWYPCDGLASHPGGGGE